jgi:hypothetical protein
MNFIIYCNHRCYNCRELHYLYKKLSYVVYFLIRLWQETVFSVKRTIFWEVTLCSLVEICLRFGETYCLHPQDWKLSRICNQCAVWLLLACHKSWRWKHCVCSKRRWNSIRFDVASKRTALFILTAVRTSNLTYLDTSRASPFPNTSFNVIISSYQFIHSNLYLLIINLITTVLSATIPQPKSLKHF